MFAGGVGGETTAEVRDRVAAARARAADRGVSANRQLGGDALDVHAPLTASGRELLREALGAGRLTMRGVQRVRAVALTLLDLAGEEGELGPDHLSQAVVLRGAHGRSEVAA